MRPYGHRSLRGSSVHGVLQTRILEWVAIYNANKLSKIRSEDSSCLLSTLVPGGEAWLSEALCPEGSCQPHRRVQSIESSCWTWFHLLKDLPVSKVGMKIGSLDRRACNPLQDIRRPFPRSSSSLGFTILCVLSIRVSQSEDTISKSPGTSFLDSQPLTGGPVPPPV